MDKQSLLNKISFILQDLKSQHLKLTGNVDRIPEIDLDLFLANASFLVNHLEVLKKINGSSPEVRERDDLLKNLFNPQELEKLLEKPILPESPLSEMPKELSEPMTEMGMHQGNEDFLPPVHNFVTEPDLQKAPIVQDISQESPETHPGIKTRNESFLETQNNFVRPLTNKQGVFAPELERKAAYFADRNEEIESANREKNGYEKPVSNSLNDTFNQELKALRDLNSTLENSLNRESILNATQRVQDLNGSVTHRDNNSAVSDLNSNQKREPSLLNRLGNLPVKDIRKAIGLNEHLLFIKTLFQGDPAIYDRTLSMIDTFNTADQAFQFLQDEISGPFNWESKKAVAELFKNIVNRKFAGNR